MDEQSAIESCNPKNPILLRYCPPNEVNQKRQQLLIFQGSFLLKMNNLKQQGQRLKNMDKLQKWLIQNIHLLIGNNGERSYQLLLKLQNMNPQKLITRQHSQILQSPHQS